MQNNNFYKNKLLKDYNNIIREFAGGNALVGLFYDYLEPSGWKLIYYKYRSNNRIFYYYSDGFDLRLRVTVTKRFKQVIDIKCYNKKN